MAKSIRRTTLSLFILRFVRMIVTVVTVTFSAKYFGTDMEKDIWVLTLAIITTLVNAVWGPVNEVFRTKFVYIREQEGAVAAEGKAASLIGFILVATVLISVVLFVGAPLLSEIMLPRMQAGAAALFVTLLLLQIPSLLLNELTQIGISILNAYDVYYLPEIVGFFSGLVNLAAIALLASSIGIYALLIGTYFGIVVLFVVVVCFLRRKGIRVWNKLIRFRWAEARVFLLFALPFFFPYFVGQINGVAEKYLAGTLGSGSIASVDYARQFISVLQGVLTSVLTTIMMPQLAKQFINRKMKDFNKTLLDTLTTCMLIYGLASIFTVGGSVPLCDFFFNRGRVPAEALATITSLTKMYGIAFFGVLIYLFTGTSLLASDHGKFYATAGVVTQIAMLVANVLACPIFGVYVFPVSLGAAHLLAGIAMLGRIEAVDRKAVWLYLLKAVAGVGLVVTAYEAGNAAFAYQSAFMRLCVMGLTLTLSLPLMALCLGFDVKAHLGKIIGNFR